MRSLTTFIITALIISTVALPVHALTQQDVELLIRAGLIPPDKIATARAAAGGNVQTGQPRTQSTTTSSRSAVGTDLAGCLSLTSTISEGMNGSAVTSLQQFLAKAGYFTAGVTGYFGPVTRQAVEQFQKAEGIVLNGTPETTGFGAVGPQTRAAIQRLTCGGSGSNASATTTGTASQTGLSTSKGDFFGYDLDALLDSYNADFNYEPSDDYELDFSYDLDSSYDVDFEYELDFDYDADFDFDFDSSYNPDFDYNPNFGAEGEAPIQVRFEVRATNGQYIAGGFEPVAVPSRDVLLRWTSANADACFLSGDFVERNISVPERGQAQVYLVNPSYVIPLDDDEGKAMFGFRLTCEEDDPFGDSASGVLMLHIATSTDSN